VTLSDCLACSGCITSAETVLLQAQSAEEFKANCRAAVASNGTRAVVVTVSPQSRVSLAHAAGLNPLDAAARLTGFFKAAGATRVFDSSSGRDFALLESCEEFVTRYKARRGATTHGVGVTTHGVMPPTPHGVMPPSTPGTPPSPPLPVLTSACPGWVCYAEKTHGPETLRHISAVKSPQAIMGTIVKRRVAAALGLTPSAVYHATVMPCFDKKLEASRDDFRDADGVPDVDCVLTTGEVAEMLAEAAGFGDADGDPAKVRAGAAALASVAPAPLDGWLACAGENGEDAAAGWLWGSSVVGGGGGSGGYLDVVFRHAARELFGVEVTGPLEYKVPRARNPDLREVTLEVDGRVALRFAAAYGFRNIQNVTRKLKTQAAAGSGSASGPGGYDFVEIMACPGGCLNGGGQLPPPPAYEPGFRLPSNQPIPTSLGGMSAKELLDELDAAYHDGRVGARGARVVVGRRAIDNPEVATAYREWIGDGVGSARAAAALRTSYHDRGAEAAAAAGGTAAAAAQLKITSDW